MTISNDKREEIERVLVSLVLNKNEIINFLQIKPKYLSNNKIAKILEYSIGCYKKFACYARYEIHKGEWIEVYRSIDSEQAHNKYWELRNNNPEKKVYIYVDEELGNSIIP